MTISLITPDDDSGRLKKELRFLRESRKFHLSMAAVSACPIDRELHERAAKNYEQFILTNEAILKLRALERIDQGLGGERWVN